MIRELKENQVFVFGSNTKGLHNKGAALQAKQDFGAIQGQQFGLQGRSFGIPTRMLTNWGSIVTLDLDDIRLFVDRFIEFAKEHPELEFLVTEIGCGLAGYTVEQIAPMFCHCMCMDVSKHITNIILPESFKRYIEVYQKEWKCCV